MDNGVTNNFRNAVINEPLLMPQPGTAFRGGSQGMLPTQFAGNVRALPAPPVPPAPFMSNYNSYNNSGYGGFGYGSGFGSGFGNSFGNSFGYGGYGGGMFGGGYNNFGSNLNPYDPEARFIQLAEANTRPAFESIQSLVSAIGNVAAMLDSTFFALTSSFRAILGVTANFGRLRGVFAQFWQTFAVFRALRFIYKKILYWLRISNLDPSSQAFKEAFAEAANNTTAQPGAPKVPRKGQSPWPVIAFLSFIFTAPYLIMKMIGTVSNTAQTEARNPAKWIRPIQTVVEYDFVARDQSELTIRAGQRLIIAPKEIQNTLNLLNSGWAIASTDGKSSGLVPINYVKSAQQPENVKPQLLSYDQAHNIQNTETVDALSLANQQQYIGKPEANIAERNSDVIENKIPTANLSTSAFAPPPIQQNIETPIPDFDIAHQPISPPTTMDSFSNFGL